MTGEKARNDLPLLLGLFAINVFWGGSFIANAIALESVGPIEIASLRFFIAAPLLAIVTLLWKGPSIFRVETKDLLTLVAMAITGVTLQYAIQVTAQSFTTAINASLLINTSTFFILFLSALFLAEKLTASRVIGAFIGFGGVALLVSGGTLGFSLGQIGDLMIILCALLWAAYSILGKKIAGKYHPLTILNWVFILGTIGLVPLYFLTPHADPATIPLSAWGAILFLALLCSIVAYLIYNVALETMDASRVALFIYLVPLATIVLAWLILGERLNLASAFGGLLVLAGMWIAERKIS
ncbi:MAG: putative transporter in sor 3'region [Methanocella sp. PtaU1.Bin125]|nr:MAG: putative transporter in sor 3'region [Methanocella sp. PtaU1.Bin125]